MGMAEMEVAITLIGWKLFITLAVSQKPRPDPRLKLPTLDEIKQMRKEVYRRFREALKKRGWQFECMAHHL